MSMRFVDIDARTKFLLLVAFMVTCVASVSAIPFLMPWGADMQNVHAFQQCVHGQSPYLVDAKAAAISGRGRSITRRSCSPFFGGCVR